MKVLVTGGAGLIGMALRPTLARAGHQVTAVDGVDYGRADPGLHLVDLNDGDELERIVREQGIEAIIHCGAISGPMMARDDPLRIVRTNIDATALLLDLARRSRMRRFVFCSSIGVYGNVGPDTITEDTPRRPTSVYGASKVAGESLVRAFAAEYGLSGVSVRPSRVYGPYRRGDCVIGAMIRDAEAGRTTVIPCDPEFLYHYVYVEDVADALVAALEATELPHMEYIVDGGEPITMPGVVEAARAVLAGPQVNLVAGADYAPDVQTRFDIRRIASDLDWRPRFKLRQGIAAYRRDMPSVAELGV
jgi:UDP-glucuronate 4-epimerase